MDTNISFPLIEVLKDLMDTDKSLAGPLIKLGQFARLTKNGELLDYVNNELNGYKKFADIPIYRKGRATLVVNFQAGYYTHEEVLPQVLIDPEYRDVFEYVFIKEGIASIENLSSKSNNGGNSSFYMPVPVQALGQIQSPAEQYFLTDTQISVVKAKLVGNSNLPLEVPNAIRTKLLDFVTAIAEEFGYNIEIDTFNQTKEINNQTINNFMGTTITNSGDGNVINTGDHNQIENTANVSKGNKQQLQNELKKLGIEEEDISEIVEIVSEEEPNRDKGLLGPKANSWITGILGKSLNGIGKLANGITVELLASLLKQYVGMP